MPVTTPLPLGAAPLTLEAIAEVARRDRPVTIADDARATMATARASIDQVVAEGDRARAVYGVNTGFGALAEVRISAAQVRQLQVNLVRSHAAVDGIDVEVRRGEAFGFLGPNGAGKSSTMRMIGCVSPASGGELRILGLDPASDGPAIRARLGVCPQKDILDEDLSVEDNLHVYGRFFGLSRSEVRERTTALLEFAQLTERRHDRRQAAGDGAIGTAGKSPP